MLFVKQTSQGCTSIYVWVNKYSVGERKISAPKSAEKVFFWEEVEGQERHTRSDMFHDVTWGKSTIH